jgi:hypothetical protein
VLPVQALEMPAELERVDRLLDDDRFSIRIAGSSTPCGVQIQGCALDQPRCRWKRGTLKLHSKAVPPPTNLTVIGIA